MRWHVPFLAGLLLAGGCYHATVTTGLAPSPQVIDKEWAHGFLWGLVPPSTVETASKCPNGVAQVETQQSFLNMVANILTSGIYSPMQITVTCAAAGGMSGTSDVVQSHNNPQAAIQQAAARSAESGQAVYVRF